jgi:hypothetical protein
VNCLILVLSAPRAVSSDSLWRGDISAQQQSNANLRNLWRKIMNSLKKCFVAVGLVVMFAATTLAACPNPGEMSGPPCTSSTQQITDDPSVETTTQSAISGEVEIITINAVIGALESLLTVY